MMVLATPALAATLLVTPVDIEITEEENFTLMVSVNPKGVKTYTTKVELEYPADLLEVESFIFIGNDWMVLSQPGYDLIDNTNGILIKTGGYPSGVSKLVTFGIVSFSAKKTGEGIIKVGDDSIVLDAENQNVLSGPLPQASVTIAAPTPPLVLPEEEITLPIEEEITPSPEEEVLPPEEEVAPPVGEVPPRPLFDILIRPVIEQVRKGPIIFILVASVIVALIIVAYIIYRRRKKKEI